MDDFERKLKQDAGRIPAEITPGLQSRIRASIEAQAAPGKRRRQQAPRRSWVAAGLATAAVAVLAFALLLDEPRPPAVADVPAAPEYTTTGDRKLPLDIDPAELTTPLEKELEDLRADLEQARRSVAEDMTF